MPTRDLLPEPDDASRPALRRLRELLDAPCDRRIERIAALVRAACGVPVALVGLGETGGRWFAANGAGGDAAKLGPTAFRAAVPITAHDGTTLGTLCAIDTAARPHGLDAAQAEALSLLAEQLGELIENRDGAPTLAIDRIARRARDDEHRYHAIIDSAVDTAIIAMDADGIVTSWSAGAERIFGWSATEMCGGPADRFFTPDDLAAGIPEREFAVARATGRAADDRWHLRKDGSRFFAQGAMTPLMGADRPGFVKAVRDVTAEHETRAALEVSRRSAEMMTAAARLGTFDYDLARGTLAWDDGCRALFGLPPGAAVTYAEAFLRGVHPDDREGADAAVAAALDPAGDGRFETEYRTIGIADGLLRHVAARGQTLFEGDRATRLLGTVQDVTEARVAEARLRETEERLRLANRATNDAIWDWDLVRDHVAWNEAITTAYGHRLDAVAPTGAWWIDHIHPDDRARIDVGIHAVIDRGGTDWTDDYRFRRADGSYADVRDRGFVLRDAAGAPLRMIGAMLDQSERMTTERALRHQATDLAERVEESNAELERLWNASPDLLVVADPDGTYTSANPAWMTILGYAEDEVLGRSAPDFLHPDDVAATEHALAVAQVGELPPYICRFRHRDGSYRWISWAAAPDRGEIFAIGRDVTAAREADEALRRTEDALRQSQKVEAVGQLTGGVAHDFNNLLTVIRGSVDLLRRPGLSDEKRIRYVDAIADTAERATRLTSQLLAFARRQTLEPQVFDVAENVASLREMLHTLTGSLIETRYDLPAGPAPVMADPSQFDTAIVNMAVNARDAMAGEGQLVIAVRIVPELPALRSHPPLPVPHVAVSIADTGAGIPGDRIEQIFEPFFTTKGVGHGTGLGLSQVFGFAKQSEGDVAVDSVVGQGTTFTLYLPLAATERPEAMAQEASITPLLPGACVLVVEDNEDVGEFATRALAELGHGSLWVRDADTAMAALDHAPGRYDVVFTDVVMPGRSGIELAGDIARRFPGLPVVLTSGYSHVLAQEGTRGLRLLRKPYSIEELSEVLAEAAGGKVPADG